MIVANKILEVKQTLEQKQQGFLRELEHAHSTSLTAQSTVIFPGLKGDHGAYEFTVKQKGLFGKPLFSTRIFEDNHRPNKPFWTVTTTVHDKEFDVEDHIQDYVHSHLRSILAPHGRYQERWK